MHKLSSEVCIINISSFAGYIRVRGIKQASTAVITQMMPVTIDFIMGLLLLFSLFLK
jgi:hypothetical protein